VGEFEGRGNAKKRNIKLFKIERAALEELTDRRSWEGWLSTKRSWMFREIQTDPEPRIERMIAVGKG
jgi:hypothetical protein